jgi:hypothetical protein
MEVSGGEVVESGLFGLSPTTPSRDICILEDSYSNTRPKDLNSESFSE